MVHTPERDFGQKSIATGLRMRLISLPTRDIPYSFFSNFPDANLSGLQNGDVFDDRHPLGP